MVAALLIVGIHHGREAWDRAVMEHVGEKQRERLVANDLAGTPDRMAQPQRGLLARKAGLAGARQILREQIELRLLAAFSERPLQLELAVEVILDHRLVAAGDEN